MEPILIYVGRQRDGGAYELHPTSRARVKAAHPWAKLAPSVFVGYDSRESFEEAHGPMWKQIAMMLTGLTWRQIAALGGIRIYDAAEDRVVKTLKAA